MAFSSFLFRSLLRRVFPSNANWKTRSRKAHRFSVLSFFQISRHSSQPFLRSRRSVQGGEEERVWLLDYVATTQSKHFLPLSFLTLSFSQQHQHLPSSPSISLTFSPDRSRSFYLYLFLPSSPASLYDMYRPFFFSFFTLSSRFLSQPSLLPYPTTLVCFTFPPLPSLSSGSRFVACFLVSFRSRSTLLRACSLPRSTFFFPSLLLVYHSLNVSSR